MINSEFLPHSGYAEIRNGLGETNMRTVGADDNFIYVSSQHVEPGFASKVLGAEPNPNHPEEYRLSRSKVREYRPI